MQAPAPKVAIVIPTGDPDREPGRTAIAQVRKTTAHLGATVHVVVSSGKDFRFSRSVNKGIQQAPDADAWVLLNDDCFMDEGWLERMLEAAARHPEVGVVGAVLRFPDGSLQHAGAYFMRALPFLAHNAVRNHAPFWAVRQVRRLSRKGMAYSGHYHRVDPRHRLGFLTGACFLVTRSCRDRVGLYDEDYEFGYEDLDYCLRVLDAGLELALATEARGVHLQTATGGGLHDAWARGEETFRSRWGRDRVLGLVEKGGRRGLHHGPGGNCGCGQA